MPLSPQSFGGNSRAREEARENVKRYICARFETSSEACKQNRTGTNLYIYLIKKFFIPSFTRKEIITFTTKIIKLTLSADFILVLYKLIRINVCPRNTENM